MRLGVSLSNWCHSDKPNGDPHIALIKLIAEQQLNTNALGFANKVSWVCFLCLMNISWCSVSHARWGRFVRDISIIWKSLRRSRNCWEIVSLVRIYVWADVIAISARQSELMQTLWENLSFLLENPFLLLGKDSSSGTSASSAVYLLLTSECSP